MSDEEIDFHRNDSSVSKCKAMGWKDYWLWIWVVKQQVYTPSEVYTPNYINTKTRRRTSVTTVAEES